MLLAVALLYDGLLELFTGFLPFLQIIIKFHQLLQPLQEKDSILGCEAVPPSPRPAGPALRQGGVLVDAYWALSYIADSSDEQRIQVLIFQQAEKPEGR